MINVTQATFLTYGGEKIKVDFHQALFKEPLWKIKEILLDKFGDTNKHDPIVKVTNLKYTEYGKET